MDDLNTRLAAAMKKRNEIEAQIQRIQGKLEAAQKSLETVEDECRAKGVNPAELDATIAKLSDLFRQQVEAFEQRIALAEKAIAPYTGE